MGSTPLRTPGTEDPGGEKQRGAKVGRWCRAHVHWLIPVAIGALFFVSLSLEAARRIMALETVENYGFAVFNQILWNFSHSGFFQQTIHRGYVDSWMWSGHKAALLPVVGILYGLKPGPIWLAQIQIGAVALGAIPAYGMGRLCLRGVLGGVVGLAVYFAYPPLYYMALSDYQDIVLAIPALMLAIYASRRGSPIGFAAAALLAAGTREEVALIVALVGFGVSGPWRRKLGFGLIGAGVAAAYLVTVYVIFQQDMHYESSAQTHLLAVLEGLPTLPPILYDKEEAARFYAGFFEPLQWLAIGSPLTLLPGAAAVGFHMLVNPENGVDRIWSAQAHIHHLAPVLPLAVAASLETLGRLVRPLRHRASTRAGERVSKEASERRSGAIVGKSARRGGPDSSSTVVADPSRSRWLARGLLVLVCVIAVGATVPAWKKLGLHLGSSLGARDYPIDPVWYLVSRIPAEAVAATDTHASLAISSRRWAYTYDESLEEKLSSTDPVSELEYILVNHRDVEWMADITARSGVEAMETRGGYTLFKLK